MRQCSTAPSVTNAAAVVHSSSKGRGSGTPRRKFITALVAHSLGRNGDVGVRSTVRKSSRLRKPSGRASCSGRISRNRRITPPAAPMAMIESRSRVRRAGNTFTRTSVVAEPTTAGKVNNGTITEYDVEREQQTTGIADAERGENRHAHQRHHPRAVHERLAQFGEIQAQPVHRRRDQQVQVLRQEKTGQGRDHIRPRRRAPREALLPAQPAREGRQDQGAARGVTAGQPVAG